MDKLIYKMRYERKKGRGEGREKERDVLYRNRKFPSRFPPHVLVAIYLIIDENTKYWLPSSCVTWSGAIH